MDVGLHYTRRQILIESQTSGLTSGLAWIIVVLKALNNNNDNNNVFFTTIKGAS